jgi:hypothetical protein
MSTAGISLRLSSAAVSVTRHMAAVFCGTICVLVASTSPKAIVTIPVS